MKISLNKEYAARHLGVAALFTGLSLWFLYDAVYVYPNLPPDGPHHTSLEFQYSAAALLFLTALTIALRVRRNWKATLTWDDTGMCGSLTGNRPLLFSDIASVDTSKWESKQILKVRSTDGRTVTLDAWHHSGLPPLTDRLTPTPDL